MPAHRRKPVLGDADAVFLGESKGEDFARSDVPRVVGLGRLRTDLPVITQPDRRLCQGSVKTSHYGSNQNQPV
jgi:hypothetical protein